MEYSCSSDIVACIKAALDERGIGEAEIQTLASANDKEKSLEPSSSQLSLSLEPPEYDQEEEARMLGEVFSLSPRAASESERAKVPRSVFLNAVLVIKGVTTFLSQAQTVFEKESLLNLDIMLPAHEEEHVVFVLLSYVSQSLLSNEKDDLRWIEEAVKSILELTSETIPHVFVKDSREICREFLDNVLLPELVATERGAIVTSVFRVFSSNQAFGSVIVEFLLQKLLEIGDLLREAERFKLETSQILDNFHVHNMMILEVWPAFAQGERPR